MALGINSSVEGTTLTLELSGRLSTQETREFDIMFEEKVQGMKQALLDFQKWNTFPRRDCVPCLRRKRK